MERCRFTNYNTHRVGPNISSMASGLVLCFRNIQRRKAEISRLTTKINGLYASDFAKRGLTQSGMAGAVASSHEDNKRSLIDRLETLKWFGNDSDSERLVDDLKNELVSVEIILEQKFFYYKLPDLLDEIKMIMQNSEVMQSRTARRNDPSNYSRG